ncbi:MAG: Coenzyme F420 hydrogenase/dehydrogenase, beta subunit C-terminal domain [Sandarakinorhabdus sp.]|nr:Coenzyme F420 hydrogenase/dehydrogenase, beta subunit C-terminal domain [Sandarakinorhabdus sp.]
MAQRHPGYLRPAQSAPLTAAQEAGIAAACPGLAVEITTSAPVDDRLWGPSYFTGTGFVTDPALRHQASSGGVISGLLVHALAIGLVDFVVQTGADLMVPTGNRTVVSHNAADVFDAAGSRYAASAPLAGLESWLSAPGRFAFVGKPCDVAALRARARTDPRVDAKVPLMLAFICAGILSAGANGRLLNAMSAKRDDVTSFRYRGDGWPGYATATMADGTTRRMSYDASWGQILSKEVQFRCKICADAVGSAADIACADAWVCDENGYPSFQETDGRSLVMARTVARLALLASARAAGAIETTPLDITEISRMQPHQARRKRQILSRLAAMVVVGRPVPRYRGLQLWAAAARENPVKQARSFAGLVRRFIQGRA